MLLFFDALSALAILGEYLFENCLDDCHRSYGVHCCSMQIKNYAYTKQELEQQKIMSKQTNGKMIRF